MFTAFSIIDVTEKRSLIYLFTIVFTKLIKIYYKIIKFIMKENCRRVTYVITFVIFLRQKTNIRLYIEKRNAYREH